VYDCLNRHAVAFYFSVIVPPKNAILVKCMSKCARTLILV
jgi:hypothetical protein